MPLLAPVTSQTVLMASAASLLLFSSLTLVSIPAVTGRYFALLQGKRQPKAIAARQHDVPQSFALTFKPSSSALLMNESITAAAAGTASGRF